MFDTTLIDVAISLAFIYFTMSLACASIHELVARVCTMRSRMLKKHIRALITDDSKRDAFYKHPLIKRLSTNGSDDESKAKIESIPTDVFTLALLDIVAPANRDISDAPTNSPANTSVQMKSLEVLLKGIENLPNEMKTPLAAAISTADTTIEQARKNIDTWFDSQMELASQVYRKYSQYLMFVYALVLAVLVNVDSIYIATHLYNNPDDLQSVVDQAIAVQSTALEKSPNLDEQIAKLEKMREAGLPFGLSEPRTWTWMGLSGWVITAFAAAAGAPFWFDFLNRFIALRKARPSATNE